jgi:hypothetical protein
MCPTRFGLPVSLQLSCYRYGSEALRRVYANVMGKEVLLRGVTVPTISAFTPDEDSSDPGGWSMGKVRARVCKLWIACSGGRLILFHATRSDFIRCRVRMNS